MDRLSSIVVGIDFSPAAAAALAQGLRMAQWNRASLVAVHVIDTLVTVEVQEPLTPLVKQIQDALMADARKAWESFAPELGDKSSIQFVVALNNQLIELLRRCQEHRADLLILGIHGRTSQEGTGVLAAQAVRRAPCDVLLTREGQTGPFKTVVVGIDFSESSRLALATALRIAAQDGGTLRIVHVIRPPWAGFQLRAPAAATSPEFKQQFLDAQKKGLEEFSRRVDPEIDWAKPRYEIVEHDNHGAGLAEYARKLSADLVVVATRGRTNLREMLIGSTAERVVRDAPCSILAVRPARA